MLPWQMFDVVRCIVCIFTSSQIQMLNDSICQNQKVYKQG